MNKEIILDQVQEIIRDEFDNEELVVGYETTANDVDGWDSLSHLSLIHEIEAHFNIKFTMGEIQSFKNVGEMIDIIFTRRGE